MSLLYKKPEDIIYKVVITQTMSKVKLEFSCDGGKHGTDEMLDEYELTPLDLLRVLQDSDY